MLYRSLFSIGLTLFISACISNQTNYTFNKWEKLGEKNGVQFESKRSPIREKDGYFKTKFVGTHEVQYRVRNKSGQERCVRFNVAKEKHTNFAGEYKKYKVIKVGAVVNIGVVYPRNDADANWTVRYNAIDVSTDIKNPCK